ncbi:MAG: hypothetical protein JNM70_24355 [Anaerolineae bacterium]|nr:hypothetical protein [Anaerolineae bacterium]
MNIRKRHAVCAGLITIVILAVLYGISVGQIRSLDSRLIPTAEAMLAKPLDKPEFIGYIKPPPGENMPPGEAICVQVFPGEMMKPGELYEELEQHVWYNTTFIINNHPLPLFTPLSVAATAWLREIVDGQATGVIIFCYTPDLAIGTHIATVRTSDLSNQEYLYSWAFRVE